MTSRSENRSPDPLPRNAPKGNGGAADGRSPDRLPEPRPVTDLAVGDRGRVAWLANEDEALLRKLVAMGVMAGAAIALEQTWPSYIVKVGRSRAALDRETAAAIWVRQDAPGAL